MDGLPGLMDALSRAHGHRRVASWIMHGPASPSVLDDELLRRPAPHVDVGDSEDEVFWTAFLRGLKDRGLSGVRLVISDPHAGLKASIARMANRWTLRRVGADPRPRAS